MVIYLSKSTNEPTKSRASEAWPVS
jgi:hypothetical protein